MKRLLTLIYLFQLVFIGQIQAQEIYPDTTYKNTARLNLTPLLVTSRAASFSIGYERIINHHQSFSANIGHLKIPDLIKTEEGHPVDWIENERNTGLAVSADYRFYFERNRYQAPDGLYWGPYVAYYYLESASRINLNKDGVVQGSADVATKINMLHAGLQLGYQFVFWDRWTLDLILAGPGVGFYNGSIRLEPDVEINGSQDYIEGVYDAIKEIYPAIGNIIEDGSLTTSGKFGFRSVGYRMAVQVGFRF